MITIYFKDALYYLNDEDFSVSILLLILCMLLPVTLYICFSKHQKYRGLDQEKKDCIMSINRIMLLYTIILLLSLIYSFSYRDSRISVTGILSQTDNKVDCSNETFDCCTVYDNCRIDGHDSYVYTVEKGVECHTLVEIIIDHIEYNHKVENCLDSEFGCCYLMTTCDSYLRLNYTYGLYSHIVARGFPYGYVNTGDSKINSEGTNCNSVMDLLEEHENMHTSTSINIMILLLIISVCTVFPYFILKICRDKIMDKIIKFLECHQYIDMNNFQESNIEIEAIDKDTQTICLTEDDCLSLSPVTTENCDYDNP